MEMFLEGDLVKLVNPLGGIDWIRQRLETEFGLDFDSWPVEIQDFLRREADEIFQGWCEGPLVCLNVSEEGTISTGWVGERAYTEVTCPTVGHIPSGCYIRIR